MPSWWPQGHPLHRDLVDISALAIISHMTVEGLKLCDQTFTKVARQSSCYAD
ncbi:hypothetical protein [Thiobacillus sp.]|uniref:hypothetical protein n=1 Tax=Thiobacillus sp. TaxID=924 RepID=UPI0025F52370|nr:hypothetical protein [Thiobacillus sp.]